MIKVGDRLPEGSFRVKQDDGSVKQMTVHELFDKQKVVSSACRRVHLDLSHAHIPTLRQEHRRHQAKGVDLLLVEEFVDRHLLDAAVVLLHAEGPFRRRSPTLIMAVAPVSEGEIRFVGIIELCVLVEWHPLLDGPAADTMVTRSFVPDIATLLVRRSKLTRQVLLPVSDETSLGTFGIPVGRSLDEDLGAVRIRHGRGNIEGRPLVGAALPHGAGDGEGGWLRRAGQALAGLGQDLARLGILVAESNGQRRLEMIGMQTSAQTPMSSFSVRSAPAAASISFAVSGRITLPR